MIVDFIMNASAQSNTSIYSAETSSFCGPLSVFSANKCHAKPRESPQPMNSEPLFASTSGAQIPGASQAHHQYQQLGLRASLALVVVGLDYFLYNLFGRTMSR